MCHPKPDDKEKNQGLKKTHVGDMMTNLDEEEKEPTTSRSITDEEVKESVTPRSKMGSNIVNNTPKKIGSSHSIRHKGPRNN